MTHPEDWSDKVFPYGVFKKKISGFAAAHPESAWHLNGSERRIWRTVREALRYLKEGDTIVDFGCIPPNIVIGFHVTGVLDSLHYYGTCIENDDDPGCALAGSLGVRLERVDLDPKVDLFPGLKSFPSRTSLPDGGAEMVIVTEVLEHMIWPHSLLEEAARVLKPGGILLGTTPNASNAGALLKCIVGETPFEWYEDSHLAGGEWMKHVRFYSFRDLRSLFSIHGLHMLEEHYISFGNVYVDRRGLSIKTRNLLRRLLHVVPWWRESLFFVAERAKVT